MSLKAFSLTDHDTVAGVDECARLAAQAGVRFLPGVEFESAEGPHVLAYFKQSPGQAVLDASAHYRAWRTDWVAATVAKIRLLGYRPSLDRVLARAGAGTPHVGHLVAEMHSLGELSSQDRTSEEYKRLFGRGAPAEPPLAIEQHWGVIRLIRAIRDSGAVAVLAHPSSPLRLDLWPEMIAAGLQGVEAYHRNNHVEKNIEYFIALARENRLIITGGWDYHGEAQATRLAQSDMNGFGPPDELLEPLLNLVEYAHS